MNKCPFKAYDNYTTGYGIYIGGRWGKQITRGRMLSRIFTDREEALGVVEKAMLFFRENGYKGERFAQVVQRIGFENVEKALLSDDLLERKSEILAMELKEK